MRKEHGDPMMRYCKHCDTCMFQTYPPYLDSDAEEVQGAEMEHLGERLRCTGLSL